MTDRSFLGPFPREKRFIYSLNMKVIQEVLWPLFGTFVLLAFLDVTTTLFAFTSGSFVELNPYAAKLFSLKFLGFVFAYFVKYVPGIPLFYIVTLKRDHGKHDFEVRLLKFTALVVLIGADTFLGYLVFANNLPALISGLGLAK